jgi:hypothetical protein
MAGATILDEIEGRLIDVGGGLTLLSGQLTGIGRDQSVLPEHSGGEVPVKLGVQGIADDDLSRAIGAALLEVVAVGDASVVVTGTACFSGAVGDFAFEGEGISVESLQHNLGMFGLLREDRWWKAQI